MSLGKLFIGGLSWETTTESLEAYYKQFGEVTDAVIMKDRNTGHPRGFGFVTYSDAAVAEKVCQDKHTIDGRTVDSKLAVARDKMPAAPQPEAGPPIVPNGPDCKKLFLGGLPAASNEDSIKRYFGQFGSIQEVLIMTDRDTGASRGFGFVTFDDSSSGAAAVRQGRMHNLDGKQVEIKPAESRESRTMKDQGHQQSGMYGGAQYGGYNQGGGGGPMRGGKGGALYGHQQYDGYGQPPYGQQGYPMGPYGYGGAVPGPQGGYGGYGNRGGYPQHGPLHGPGRYNHPDNPYAMPQSGQPQGGQYLPVPQAYSHPQDSGGYGQPPSAGPMHGGMMHQADAENSAPPPPPYQAQDAQPYVNPQNQVNVNAHAVALENVINSLAGQLAEIKNTTGAMPLGMQGGIPPAQAVDHAQFGQQQDARQPYHPYAR